MKQKLAIFGFCWVLLIGVADAAILLTGQIASERSQNLVVPLGTRNNLKLIWLAEEGAFVEPGDLVAEFDGTTEQGQVEQIKESLLKQIASTKRDTARLAVELSKADYAMHSARVEMEKARMEAAVPEQFIGALQFEENQLTFEKNQNAHEEAIAKQRHQARLLAEKRESAELEEANERTRLQWYQNVLKRFKLVAQQPGYVIHGLHPWQGTKFQEGDNVFSGMRLGEIADVGRFVVHAWAHEIDRPRISDGQKVNIWLDAQPKVPLSGTIEQVNTSGEEKRDWGQAQYHKVIVQLDGLEGLSLLPGMSVLVEIPEASL